MYLFCNLSECILLFFSRWTTVLLPPGGYPIAVKYIISYIISHHIISYIISYHIISYHIISYHIISYHIISYHIISYHIMSDHVFHLCGCYSSGVPCFNSPGFAIPKHAGPEAKGSNPATGITLLWARKPIRGNFIHLQVSRKEAGQIFFERRHEEYFKCSL